ncbi:MAG: hypothetical protein R3313_03965, partial [Candidatus Saccharimonadales bacterium]|nr:hypothetical protein [Candidatus Saccharimonadales bacterium]
MTKLRGGALVSRVHRHTKMFYLILGVLFAVTQFLFFVQPAQAATEFVGSEAELVAALADASNDEIDLVSDFPTYAEVIVDRSVTINGNGFAILPMFSGSDFNNSALEISGVDGVTIHDLIIDGTASEDIHGLNIYESTNVLLNNLSSSSHAQSGIVVNGSTVMVIDVTTFGNGWHGINVDQGSGVTDPAILTVEGISIQTDFLHIYLDNTLNDVVVNDVNGQYLVIDPPGAPDNDRLYQLDPDRFVYDDDDTLKIDICHANNGVKGFTSNSVAVEGLNGHGDHEEDIIPPNPYLPDGLNWDRMNAYFWENGCDYPDDPQEVCEEGPGWAGYVEYADQGTTKNGGEIGEARSDPKHVLGDPDATTGPDDGFYALGVEGTITVGFDGYVADVDGNDLSFHEVTNGRSNYPEETVEVEVSQDGSMWYPIGAVTNHDGGDGVGYLDFSPTGLSWIQYVRITEATDFGPHSAGADGYDLDAVDASYIICEEPEPTEPCSISLFSDTSNMVSDTYAEELSYVHPAWTADIPGATWIWGDDPVVDSTVDETQTFVKTFGWNGPVDSAVLDLASDNYHEVYLNGSYVGGDSAENNFQLATQDWYDLSPYVETGENTLEIVVTNKGVSNSSPRSNPAGLLYAATITGPAEDCGEPPEPVEIYAYKVVCESEEYLPNWGSRGEGPDEITENTAERWVAESDGNCWMARWLFQWAPDTANPGDQVEEAGWPWTTFSHHVELYPDDLEETNKIWVREVFQEGFVPFSGANQTEDYSAELYCGEDVLNYDNFDYIQGFEPGDTYFCVGFNAEEPDTFEIVAEKVICSEEQYLPNWGDGEPLEEVTSNTAQRWVDASEGECFFAEDWEFQWAPNTTNPGDNLYDPGEPWTPFFGSVELGEEDMDGDKIWVREALPEGWLGFGGANTVNDWSAELYCGEDVLNYDNFDYLLNPELAETYYCVAFNTPAIGEISGLIYNDTSNNGSQELD